MIVISTRFVIYSIISGFDYLNTQMAPAVSGVTTVFRLLTSHLGILSLEAAGYLI